MVDVDHMLAFQLLLQNWHLHLWLEKGLVLFLLQLELQFFLDLLPMHMCIVGGQICDDLPAVCYGKSCFDTKK